MILNRRLVRRAHQKVIYVETQAEKDAFVALVERHKVKRGGGQLTTEELTEINGMLNEPDATAMCYEEKWLKPVILFYSRKIAVGDAFWKHELIHYQLRRYRRLKKPAAGGLLILNFLSMIPKENLDVFFDVTSRRYGERYLIEKHTNESILRFLEEMLVCSLVDYENRDVMKSDIERLNQKSQGKYLKKAEKFLGHGQLKKLRTIKLGVFFWLFHRKIEKSNKDLAYLINRAYQNPGARW